MKLAGTYDLHSMELQRLWLQVRKGLSDAASQAGLALTETLRDVQKETERKRAQNQAYRAAMEELKKIDDAELRDLRMCRADFRYLAKRKAGML